MRTKDDDNKDFLKILNYVEYECEDIRAHLLSHIFRNYGLPAHLEIKEQMSEILEKSFIVAFDEEKFRRFTSQQCLAIARNEVNRRL